MFILLICCISVLLICLFWILLQQSKKPTGYIGIGLMHLWNRVYLPLVKWTMTKIVLRDKMAILDIGVGNGVSSRYLLQQANSLSITGIDISKDAIAQAKKNTQNETLKFETMDVHSLSFAPETFDFVTAFQTHFHWNNLDNALSEINRVLKRKGLVVFSFETAKINYFLPKFKKSADFQTYLSDHGFLLSAHHTTNQWSMYVFQKE